MERPQVALARQVETEIGVTPPNCDQCRAWQPLPTSEGVEPRGLCRAHPPAPKVIQVEGDDGAMSLVVVSHYPDTAAKADGCLEFLPAPPPS